MQRRTVGSYAMGFTFLFIGCLVVSLSATAADWPTWRHDANRSGATDEQLPARLHLNWWRQYLPQKPAWPEDPRIQFDAVYEPVIMGKTMFVASSRNDSLTAIDCETGGEKWRFYADGPVRFAPIASDGKVFFAADDGRVYCLKAATGDVLWAFQAAPGQRKVIGNERLISVWPVRGGPVLTDGKIQFTAGVWPFEGNFLYTLDAGSGQVLQTELGKTSTNAPPKSSVRTLKDLTPQGYLAATGSRLYIPCGRSVTACLDQNADKFLSLSYGTHGTTSYHVSVIDRWLFHGAVAYDTQTKRQVPISARAPVFTKDVVYFADNGVVNAYDLKNPKLVETKDRRGRVVKNTVLTKLWSLPNDKIREVPKGDAYKAWIAKNPLHVDIKAGKRLYGHQGGLIFAIDLPSGDAKPAVSWKMTIEGTPASMLAANGKLFAVTREGRIHCFSATKRQPAAFKISQSEAPPENDDWSEKVAGILKQPGSNDGYCLLLGIAADGLVDELLRQSSLRIIAVDPDRERIVALRKRMDGRNLYGTRVVAHAGDPLNFGLPQYLANLVIVDGRTLAAGQQRKAVVQAAFHSLRPYGGSAVFEVPAGEQNAFAALVAKLKLPKAEVRRAASFARLTRVGALPGSADWTHEYGDPSNTLMSRDQLVKAPLGVLWFGGPAADGSLFYNRHYWGPSMAVIGGRMFIQGPGKLTAVDVYTGRILWQKPVEDKDNYRPGRRGNDFEKVLAGFHFLVVDDGIYLVDQKKRCVRLDPATGKQLAEFRLPDAKADWGRIRVKGNLLIAEVFRNVPKLGNLAVALTAMNRHSGKVVWTHKADMSFPVISVSDDKVFCFDGALDRFYKDWERRGLIPKAKAVRYLKAIDLKTGKVLWKYTTDRVVTWLGYSGKNDVVMASNKKGMAAYRGKDGSELWRKYTEGKGFRGHPESYWDRVIVWNNWVIDQRGPGAAFELLTGKPAMRKHPISGKPVPWEFTKSGHHCNYAIASPHLLTFRAASAGFCDIASGNTGRLDGFRSGCRNSLIPANGVLNAPNFAHGCVCGYSLFTSLAFTHLPEAEVWSYSATKFAKEEVQRIGINFGAPGDRLASNGTLWLDHPNVGGSSPTVSVKVNATQPRYFRRHSSLIQGGQQKWVSASGVEGVSSVTVALAQGVDKKPKNYTVRLHFSEPENLKPGQRVFGVSLQGKNVLNDFDIVGETGKRNRVVVKEFKGIRAGNELTIALAPRAGKPILCGVEVVVEQQ